MAGTFLDSELTVARASRVTFDVAGRKDDAAIRRLLRENPMAGRIALTFEREPDYFADSSLAGETKQTIVARMDGRIVCMGSCAFRQRFVNGTPARVGYLGALRLDFSVAGRMDILRRGYEFFRDLQSAGPADWYFTSIASDNLRARRLLERGARGFPIYDFIGEFVTLVMTTCCPNRDTRVNRQSSIVNELAGFLRASGKQFQFAPAWSASDLADLELLGLPLERFHIHRENSRFAACAALWDQRGFRQTVVRGYAPALAAIRPAFNLIARPLGLPRLPRPDQALANGFISHLACADDKPDRLLDLIRHCRALASQSGLDLVTIGFAANDPRLPLVQRAFRHREYRSRLYVVHWPGIGHGASDLDHRIPAPEVATL
ncbi:MAG TPA: hypothetical protein GYA07_08815 [Verrucomicrobia bacterium]|nr:hypothetical protein [Verrucomicrobiota bacterium]HOB31957.1 hypothetical protein [Verrucomicrobiota bacterium]HOP98260.1 hypothetical protein [Verrucomicrobiota bacterium]